MYKTQGLIRVSLSRLRKNIFSYFPLVVSSHANIFCPDSRISVLGILDSSQFSVLLSTEESPCDSC